MKTCTLILAAISFIFFNECCAQSNPVATEQNTILFKNTLRYEKGKLNEFKQSLEEAILFAKKNAPQLFVHVYLDETNGLAYSYQFFRNSSDVLKHWEISQKEVNNVMVYSTVVKFEVFGSPSTEVVAGINQALDKSIVYYYKEFTGYDNFCEMR